MVRHCGTDAGGGRLYRWHLLIAGPVLYLLMAPLYLRSERNAIATSGASQPAAPELLFPPLLPMVAVSALGAIGEIRLHGSGGIIPFITLVVQVFMFFQLRTARNVAASRTPTAQIAHVWTHAGFLGTPALPQSKQHRGGQPQHDVVQQNALGRGRISVVLPCAQEGDYAMKTVMSFCDRTPAEALQEIIVVDDGSAPPIKRRLESVDKRCKLRVLRHEQTMGLMIAKQTGGDAAVGEFIGFFDCHVAPNRGWHLEIIKLLQLSPRRLVVPLITDLDLDIWDERASSAVNAKCYIDWNADFAWFEDDSDFIPIISGGLVAIGKQWWHESGGFDKDMRGWGGENVDQSLRTWLCGGDIVRAKSSRVAHMWRLSSDKRTSAHYHLVTGTENTARVAAAWFDDFRVKFKENKLSHGGPDVSKVLERKHALGCKPFVFFLHRFRRAYIKGGVLPELCFHLRTGQWCIERKSDNFHLRRCEAGFLGKRTVFHLANRDPAKHGECCSGIRQWNTLDCFDRFDETGPLAYWCDLTGSNANQQWTFLSDGRIRHGSGACLGIDERTQQLRKTSCDAGQAAHFEKANPFSPEETRLYSQAVEKLGLSEDMPDN